MAETEFGSNQFHWMALADSTRGYGLLPEQISNRWRELDAYLSSQWKLNENPLRLSAMSGCLDKLRSTLYVAQRLHQFEQVHLLRASVTGGEGTLRTMAMHGHEACADFECLLLQSRAALDRLTGFVSKEYRQSCSSFKKLTRIVTSNRSQKSFSSALLGILGESRGYLLPIISKIESDSSLRDLVAHYKSATEMVDGCFHVYFLPNGSRLIFDAQVGDFPILNTTVSIIQNVSFVVLSALSLCCEIGSLSRSAFLPTWTTQSVFAMPYLRVEAEGGKLTEHHLSFVRKMNHHSFELVTRNVDPGLFERALPPE